MSISPTNIQLVTAPMHDPSNINKQLPLSLYQDPVKLFDMARAEHRPLYCAAPMVRYSKLAFRETVAHFGADLVWTPMILAKEFNRSAAARDSEFSISSTSPPTIIQLATNYPTELSRTTTLIAPYVNGIDLNCGCPQSWACSANLGAALMNERALVATLITTAKTTLQELALPPPRRVSVSVKIRIHADLRHTLDFIQTIEAAGVDFVTIHGRTRRARRNDPVDVDAIANLVAHCNVPVIANGDIFTRADADRLAAATGARGVMAARGLLENPALFDRRFAGDPMACRWDAVDFFMNRVVRQPIPFPLVLHHLSEMLGSDRSQAQSPLVPKAARIKMLACDGMLELIDFFDDLREVRRFE